MLKLIRLAKVSTELDSRICSKIIKRTFLSAAYHCNTLWEARLNQPLFQKVNLDELYFDLDQKYQRTKELSFIDVDVFSNAVTDDTFSEEMVDLVHKLRMTSETVNTLPSTSYAVVKNLIKNDKIEDLHIVLEDRLNYGIFLDTHVTNILLDYFWKKKDFVSGARIASHGMLQEDPEHPITFSLSLLHCYNCLLNKGEWSQLPGPEEPKEEVKVRVKYIRNEYNDQHFDLKDSNRIIGKTLMYLTKNKNNGLYNSFYILGASLFGSSENINGKINTNLLKEIVDLIPEDHQIKTELKEVKLESTDVNSILQQEVKNSVEKFLETDIANQCKLFEEWDEERLKCLRQKEEILEKRKRMEKVETLRNELKEKETKLWFFENEENIELEIEQKEEMKKKDAELEMFQKPKRTNVEEEYIPPSIRK